jgi:hypothetical protein
MSHTDNSTAGNSINITANLQHIRKRIAAACDRVHRSPDDVTLVAISKKKPVANVLEAIAAGVTHFGENRVGEALQKIPAVNQQTDTPPVWHMVGHIQSRKTKDVIPVFDVIESVDRLKIARYISRLTGEYNDEHDTERVMPVLLEINISGEEAKYGFEASNWQASRSVRHTLWQAVRTIHDLPHLEIRGLMTLAPFYDDPQRTRPVFAALADLRDALRDEFGLALPDLSMGMTSDYEIAIEEGATMVRIGRAIFGERD